MKHIVSKNNLFKILLFIFEKLMKLPNKHFEIFPHLQKYMLPNCSTKPIKTLFENTLTTFQLQNGAHCFLQKKSTFHPKQNKIHFVNFIAIYD